MTDAQRLHQLESLVEQMLRPMRGVPFDLVVKSISGKRLVPFDPYNPDDVKLLKTLGRAIRLCAKELQKNGVSSDRPNEVGNYIETPVKNALAAVRLKADTPSDNSGKKRSAGYPDIIFYDHVGRPNYLECKTYNRRNADTTQRSFYLSPSQNFKVTEDAHHFLLSFEMEERQDKIGQRVYVPQSFVLLTLDNLLCDVKYEFNSDNRRLYEEKNVLLKENLR